MIDGRLTLDDEDLGTGDAVTITGPIELAFSTTTAAELILVDVPLEFEPVGVWAGEF